MNHFRVPLINGYLLPIARSEPKGFFGFRLISLCDNFVSSLLVYTHALVPMVTFTVP